MKMKIRMLLLLVAVSGACKEGSTAGAKTVEELTDKIIVAIQKKDAAACGSFARDHEPGGSTPASVTESCKAILSTLEADGATPADLTVDDRACSSEEFSNPDQWTAEGRCEVALSAGTKRYVLLVPAVQNSKDVWGVNVRVKLRRLRS